MKIQGLTVKKLKKSRQKFSAYNMFSIDIWRKMVYNYSDEFRQNFYFERIQCYEDLPHV